MGETEGTDWPEDQVWRQVRRTWTRGMRTSLHCAIATNNPDGTPHVTPIGSVMLTGPGKGVYFDVLNVQLARNLDLDPRLTVLAIDSGKRLWARSLLSGRFDSPPGLRLTGTAGPKRPVTPDELDRWRRAVGPLMRTRGARILWADLRHARDLTFDAIVPVRLGRLTRELPLV